MDKLKASVMEKLEEYNLKSFETVDKKNQERLLQAEKVIEESESKSKILYEQLKDLKLSKSLICESEHTNFSRKTIYNHEILNEYIENSINNSEDYFNEKQINKLSDDLEQLKELYDNVVCNIIKTLVLENELISVKDTVKTLKMRNDKLTFIIKEKEEIIKKLQNGNNVVPFKKE